MNYCSVCAAPLVLKIPAGDNLPRYVCQACASIHYRNPRMVVGSLPVWQGRVLLCRRAIEPKKGLWTLPAGFMENGESMEAGALRETIEEAGAHVQLQALYTLYSVPMFSQVHAIFRAQLLDCDYAPGAETLEIKLFSEADIPWEAMAFATVVRTLRHFFADIHQGVFSMHSGSI